jgi:epoxyqueuosine reductase QueG
MTTVKAPYPQVDQIKPWDQEEFMKLFHRRSSEGDLELTKKCKEIAIKAGGELAGIGDIHSSDWDHVQKGFRPVDYMPHGSRIFSTCVARYDFLMDESEMNIRVLAEEFQTKPAVRRASSAVARYLEKQGYQVVNHGAMGNDFQAWRIHNPRQAKIFRHFWWGTVSEKHIAVSCGLGRLGVNNIFMTQDFGPRVHLSSFLTDAPLIPEPIWPEEICLEKKGIPCGKCYTACPAGALHGDGSFESQRCFAYGNESFGVPLTYVYWKPCPSPCVTACPVGGETHLRRSKKPHPTYTLPTI